MFRFLLTVGFLVFGFFAEKKAYDTMAAPGGSASGLVAMVVVAAIFVLIIAGIWSTGKENNKAIKSPVRPLRH